MIAGLVLLLLVAGPPAPGVATSAPRGQALASVQGRVRSAGERAPVAGAKIFATPRRSGAGGPAWTREAVSQADGGFVLTGLPSREFVLTIVAPGHERFEQPTPARYWSVRTPPTIYLQPTGAGRYRTIVAQGREVRASPTSRRLAPEEVASLPGSQGDPLRALQNLPGVARVPGGLGLLVLRGATPNQSQVFYGEHPLPRAFHVPGLASVIPGSSLAGITYVPGNFDSSFGNAVGGIVTMTPRVGRRDGIHGMAKVDLISAGAMVEGPMREGSFLVGVQRGYLDLALGAMAPLIGSSFALPRYYDYQMIFDHPVGRGGSLTLRLFGVGDEARYPTREESFRSLALSLRSQFHRIDVAYRKRAGRWDLLLAPALRLDRGAMGYGDQFLRSRDDVVGLLRAEATARPARSFTWTIGADTQIDRFTGLSFSAAIDGPAMREEERASFRGLLTRSGAYLTAEWQLGSFRVSPGVRMSVFTGERSAAQSLDPRLTARWQPHERVAVSLGAGIYSQPSQSIAGFGSLIPYQQLKPGRYDPTVVIDFGQGAVVLPSAVRYLDPSLQLDPTAPVGAARARQVSGGVHVDVTDTLDLDVTGFYRRVDNHTPPTQPGQAGADSGSLAHGVEVMLRKALSGRVYGWLAYTWMRAQQFSGFGGRVDYTPAAFDQRHNLVAVVQAKLPRRWEIGARFRVVTGLPYTPFVGAVYAGYLCDPCGIQGEYNSARMPVFHQLDVRIDKTWVLRRAVVAGYFDVQNVYNRQNAEALLYNRYYSGTTAVVGVPILPVIGLRVSY